MLPQVSPEGKVLQWLMDPNGSVVNTISSVTEHGGKMYFGNVAGDYVSHLDKRNIPSEM